MQPSVDSHVRNRRMARCLSSPGIRTSTSSCQPLPHSIEALDLSTYTAFPVHTLASLRELVLSYLEELETQLSNLESPDVPVDIDAWWSKGELTIDDARQWITTALDMLASIRQDVYSHLPDHVPSMVEMRSHLPDMPDYIHLPHLPTLSDMRTKFDDVLGYVPTLSAHMQILHSHLSDMQSHLGAGNAMVSELLDTLLGSGQDLALQFEKFEKELDLAAAHTLRKGEDLVEQVEHAVEQAAASIASAISRSFHGVRLISYDDLPPQWRNNPYVVGGYRFIPLDRWPLIIWSVFTCHNETLNIHTHLIPAILWAVSTFAFSLVNAASSPSVPEMLFMGFALLCLFTSSVWHTMAGCAHPASMEFCARVDYVGIGWLISASVGTVVYSGFQCHPTLGNSLLVLCFLTGLAGNIFPFMEWFNDYQYRFYRVLFFLSLIFSSITPLFVLAHLHSAREVLQFIKPVGPSLLSYTIGLLFYVSHAPERWCSENWKARLDMIGGGSHCIWHCFIVLAVSQHRAAIGVMMDGLGCGDAYVSETLHR